MGAFEKLSRCRFCGEPRSGWRCPGCGRPVPAFGCLTALLPTVLTVTLLGFFLPGERAPAVFELPGGATEYVFQPLREAVLVPAGLAVFAVFIALTALLFRPRRPRREEAGAAAPARAGRGLGWALALAAAALAVLALAGLSVLSPTTHFRRAVVTPERVRLHALLRSWSLARSEVAGARLEESSTGSGGALVYDFSIEVEEVGGRVHTSVRRRAGAAEMPRWHAVMSRFVEELNAGEKPGEGGPGPGGATCRDRPGAPPAARAASGRGAWVWRSGTSSVSRGRGAAPAGRFPR